VAGPRLLTFQGTRAGTVDLTEYFHSLDDQGLPGANLWVFGVLSEGVRYFAIYIPSPKSRVRAFLDAQQLVLRRSSVAKLVRSCLATPPRPAGTANRRGPSVLRDDRFGLRSATTSQTVRSRRPNGSSVPLLQEGLERADLHVEAPPDAGDLAAGYTRRDAHRLDQVVDTARRDALHVDLGDHGSEGGSIRQRGSSKLGKKLPARSLGIFGAFTRQRLRQPGALVLTALLALFNVVGTLVGMTYAGRDLSSGLPPCCFICSPSSSLYAALISACVLDEQLTRRRVPGRGSGVVRVVLVLVPQGHGRVSWLGWPRPGAQPGARRLHPSRGAQNGWQRVDLPAGPG
jgi:hypothetical protein